MDKVLEVKNLITKLLVSGREFTVVDNLSFSLSSGKTLAIVGESGCGKTMTALSLMRILPSPPLLPPQGEVWFQGRNILSLPEKELRKIRGKEIAMIFQDPMSALNPVYTVGSQLQEVIDIHLGLGEEEGRAMVLQALEDVGIQNPAEKIDAYPHQLSGGMKQRVMIAMALLCEPAILIADEPTTALDVTVQKQVLGLMRELQRRRGTALLLITHDMGVVAEMADEVLVMYATKEMEAGSVFDIFDHMAHPYTQALFQSLPGLKPPHEKLETIRGSVPSIEAIPTGCPFHPRCPHVMEICKQGKVPNFSLEREGHTVRCWLWRS